MKFEEIAVSLGLEGTPENLLFALKEMLDKATEFEAGPCPVVNGKLFDPSWADKDLFLVHIQKKGKDSWAICFHRRCLNWDGNWEYEPMPSSRSEEFIARTRFSLLDAFSLYKEWAKEVNLWAKEELAKGAKVLNIPDDLFLRKK